jgi:hypothetical protein
MKGRKINIPVLLVFLGLVCLLVVISFLAVVENSEGHATSTTLLMEKLFMVLRFPILTLMLPFIREGWALPYLIFMALFVNAILYALLIERLCTWIFGKRRRQAK